METSLAAIADRRGRALAQLVARAQFERGLSARAESILLDAFKEATGTYLDAAAGVILRDRQRVARVVAGLTDTLTNGYRDAAALTTRELTAYAGLEAQVAAGDLAALVGSLDAGGGTVSATTFSLGRVQAEAIARLPALVDGLPLGEGWADLAARASASARRAVQVGMALGETPDQLVRRILPPRGTVTTDVPAVWNGSRAQARTFVRTSVTSVQNAAALATYEAGGDQVSGEYEWVAVRDSRTSKICASLDGQRWRYDDPRRKVPPAHPNCRSTTVPIPNWDTLGMRAPSKGDPRTAPLTFDSFDTWLGKQPQVTQNAILGPSRADLYRAGTVGLRQLVDEDTRVLTLPELRKKLGLA